MNRLTADNYDELIVHQALSGKKIPRILECQNYRTLKNLERNPSQSGFN